MRFWATLVCGIAIVSAVGTAIYVYNPHLQIRNEPIEVTPQKSTNEQLPQAVADALEKTEENIPQQKQGETVFHVTNKGQGPLSLRPDYPNCRCAGSEVRSETKRADGTFEFVRIVAPKSQGDYFAYESSDPGREHVVLQPGERAQIIIKWDSKMRMGRDVVRAPFNTNDPVRKMTFSVVLDVKPDVFVAPLTVDTGIIAESQPSEQSAVVYSTIYDNLKLLETTTSSKSVQVKTSPIPADEMKKLGAKSGAKLHISIDGTLPVGGFYERVSVRTSIRKDAILDIGVQGEVAGKIEVVPSGRINFQIVTGGGALREDKRTIFVPGLPPGTKLNVGEYEPKFLVVTLDKHPKVKTQWTLVTKIPADARIGEFQGFISICDQNGVKKLNIPVRGIVAGSALETADTRVGY